ncbi:MAG: pilus assembly PilX N-terminal domain-containing protein [Candidatus Omnitrophota bacterium]|nr:MAG: pilus assembly PilX N-terminal domain-containing protein [Candidatus Omnitrophota bacterium]
MMNIKKKELPKRKAFGVVAAVLIMLLVAVMGVTVAYLMGTDISSSANYQYSQQALFIAEGGLRYYLEQLKRQVTSWSLPPEKSVNEPLGAGTFTITTANEEDDEVDLTSTGYITAADGTIAKRVVYVHLKRILPPAFKYATYSDTNVNLSGKGEINGDTAADQHVHGEQGWKMNGDVEEGADIDFPYMDFPSYAKDADYIVDGSFTFEEGKTYEGIYYITQNAFVENGVTIEGSVIAEQNIEVKGKDINLSAQGGYPALAAQLNININCKEQEETISIEGLVYTEQNFILVSKGTTDITGSVIAKQNVNITSKGNTTITYDPDIIVTPPPYFSSIPDPTIDWDEIY